MTLLTSAFIFIDSPEFLKYIISPLLYYPMVCFLKNTSVILLFSDHQEFFNKPQDFFIIATCSIFLISKHKNIIEKLYIILCACSGLIFFHFFFQKNTVQNKIFRNINRRVVRHWFSIFLSA